MSAKRARTIKYKPNLIRTGDLCLPGNRYSCIEEKTASEKPHVKFILLRYSCGCKKIRMYLIDLGEYYQNEILIGTVFN